jgi:Putative Actinobacterial Holin-X, holin superfamily III
MLSDVLHKVLHDAMDRLPEIIACQLRVVKNEVREELKETGGKAIQVAGLFGLGIVFAIFAMGYLLVAIALGLTMVMPMWGVALLIALGTAIAAGALIVLGRKHQLRTDP